jgi:proline dehydrogenase
MSDHPFLHNSLLWGMQACPSPLLWRFARRYVAGRSLDEAWPPITNLAANGYALTLDVLGEGITDPQQAAMAVDHYQQVLKQFQRSGLPANISLKPSQFGLSLNAEAAYTHIAQLVSTANAQHGFVRLDMEDAQTTDATLALYARLRQDWQNVGVVLQARLHRTPADAQALIAAGCAHIRLCKGIYLEPAAIAHTQPADITQAYNALMLTLLANTQVTLALATHDPVLLEIAVAWLADHPEAKNRVEFQLLLGVAPYWRRKLLAEGHRVRIYVPFGHQWKTYCLRRFRENPTLLGHVWHNIWTRNS